MDSRKKRKQNHNLEKVVLDTNDPLFQYIKPRDNDYFSDMKGLDLQELLYFLDNYYLKLRNRLGFDDDVTFGLELEFENAMRNRIESELIEYHLDGIWKIKNDETLIEGAEINSPVLKDKIACWKKLSKICSIVQENAKIGENSGGHIHVGTQVLGDNTESWLNFIKLWSVYENIIYRFSYGDELCARTSMIKYAEPMAKKFWYDYKKLTYMDDQISLNYILKTVSYHRYQAVNFKNVSNFRTFELNNTIEFRCPNGTLEPVIWQNNVNFFINLLKYVKSSRYDDDIVQKRRIINGDNFFDLKLYDEIYLQQALELCDMIFTSNFDKVYFLRQYLKSFESKKRTNKAKIFIKK